MNISSLHNFLASSKANLESAIKSTLGDTHVVLGNEAADIDSIVCSLVLAYYTAHTFAKEEKENLKGEGQQTLVFPVINCLRDDLPLRTEVFYFLKSHSINADHLICKDEIDLASLQSEGKLKLTLVDHNVLATADSYLQPSIVRVIDHHKRDKPLDRRDIIEPVGSCATLVAEIVLGLFDKDPTITSLLYGTIIYDTVNLSPTAQRATPKDFKLVGELEEYLFQLTGSRPNRDEVYSPIAQARADISTLTPDQLLRKDAKLLKTPEISIAVPMLPVLSQKFLELPNAIDALKNYMKVNRCTAVVAMGWEVTGSGEGEMRRDVAIFSDSIHKAKQVRIPLENCENLQLQLIRHVSEPQALVWVYDQNNVACSRKFMLPFLGTHFETKAQKIDVDAFIGVETLIEGEMSPNKFNSVPSISYTNLQVGDPISQSGSSQNSCPSSCPYTPQNSNAELEDGVYGLDQQQEHYFLPSFNSREMIEKIEQKRGKLRGYEKMKDELNASSASSCLSYPFTPKNSYVDSSLDAHMQRLHQQQQQDKYNPQGGILNAIDSEVLLRKLMEKRKNDPTYNYSNSSSKSQSLTKLNSDESCAGDTVMTSSPSHSTTPPDKSSSIPSAQRVTFSPNSRPAEFSDPKDSS